MFWYCQYHKRYHTKMTRRFLVNGCLRMRRETNEPLICESGLIKNMRSRRKDGIVENISQETIDCMAQHIKAFHEQDACGKVADFGEPCATCKHVKECGFDWLAKMKPAFEQSGVTIQLCYSGRLRKQDNCWD